MCRGESNYACRPQRSALPDVLRAGVSRRRLSGGTQVGPPPELAQRRTNSPMELTMNRGA